MDNNQYFIKIKTDYESNIIKLILFALNELPFSMGAKKLTAVLTGKKTTFNIEHCMNELESFGLFSNSIGKILVNYIETLIEYGLIDVVESNRFKMPVLQLTDEGKAYLFDESDLYVSLIDEHIDKTIEPFTIQDEIMFNKIKKWRAHTALLLDIPPYVILYDRTIREIVYKKPNDESELLSISGIGQKTVDEYGLDILNIVGELTEDIK